MRRPVTQPKPAPPKSVVTVAAPLRIPPWVLALFLALVTVVLFWPATNCDFINYDDGQYVLDNPHMTSGLTLANLRWAMGSGYAGNWHPVTWLSHMLDCQLFGLKPWGHHLTGVLLHAVNTLLVFLLLRGLTGAIWRSLFVAALFAVHPLRVESVAWVAERKDVLSTFFGLLSLIFYARYAQKTEVRSQKSEVRMQMPVDPVPSFFFHLPSSISYLLALIFFALGLMSKPMLVTWPFVLLLLDYWPLQRFQVSGFKFQVSTLKRLLAEKIPFFALAAAASVVTFAVQNRTGAVMTVENMPLGARVGNALISYCRYLGKLIRPTDLAVFYPRPEQWPLVEVLAAGGLLLGITVLLVVRRQRYPFMLMGWLWYVGTLVPVIGLVQVGDQALADRYSYIPSLGLLILVIWGAYEFTRRWRYRVMVLSAVVAAPIFLFTMLTRQQLGCWLDSETLFRHALAVTENNHLAHGNLGDAFLKKGRTDEAINQYQEVIRLKPYIAEAHFILGFALADKGRTDDAIRQYQEAIRLKPDDANFLNNLGYLWTKRGENLDQARAMIEKALKSEPKNAAILDSMGWVLLKEQRPREALNYLLKAVENSNRPDASIYDHLGDVYAALNQRDQAVQAWRQSLALEPSSLIQKKLVDLAAH